MLCRLHLKECFRKTLLQLLSLVLSGSDAPAAPLSSGGEGKELHCAPPIREPGCSGAPRLALRVNKLYPEILSPPPRSVSHHFFYLLSYHLLSLFSHSDRYFVSIVLFITVIFLLSPSSVPPSLPLLISSTGARENKLSLSVPAALLLYERASATWRSLKVHVPNSATLVFFLPLL